MGAELFHADGQTVRYDKAESRFPQIGNAPKNHSNVNGYAGQDILWQRMLYNYLVVISVVDWRAIAIPHSLSQLNTQNSP